MQPADQTFRDRERQVRRSILSVESSRTGKIRWAVYRRFAPALQGICAAASRRPPVSTDYRLAGRIDVSARSSYDAGSTNSPDERQKGYAQLDANLDLSPNSSSWTISLFGRNLTDKRYLSFALPTIPATFGEMGTYSRGRQLGVRLSGRF